MVAPMEFERTPEWLLGEDVDGGRQFVIHTATPAFIAEIFEDDDPAGILDQISFHCPSGQSLARFYWYDDAVTDEKEFIALCSRAAEFIAEYDRIVDEETNDNDG